MIKIIPSILVSSEKEFKTEIEAIKKSVNMVQIDLADGKFTPKTTWAYKNPQKARKYLDIDFELHLMVKEPLKTIKKWQNHPRLKRLLIHYEAVKDLSGAINKLKPLKKKIILVLNPDTPLSVILPYAKKIQGVMLMGVIPGFQGQKFIPKTLSRIKSLKNKKIFVEADGGVNEKNLLKIAKAGADAVCPGSAIFCNERSPAENIKRMKSLASQTEI